MKIIGIIPARGGSKGIPGKNIRILGDKPLICHTIEAALASNLEQVIVSTDDLSIAKISRQAGAGVIMRPPELATDNTPTLPVLQHVLAELSTTYDAVMTLQPTSPFRTTRHINEAIQLFAQDPHADSLVSTVQVPHQFNPASVMLKDEAGYLVPFLSGPAITRRQEKPVVWARNGAAIYITRTEKLIDYIFGGKLLAYEMGKLESLDLDDLEDWAMAELLWASSLIQK